MLAQKIKQRLVVLALVIGLFLSVATSIQSVAAESFNPNNLISDGEFIDINSMTVGEIQRFLDGKGGFLRNYSENGRSAAQIIWDAAHGYGDASGSINGITINSSTGTISPKAILVTLQKEQSLITMTSQSDSALRTAMGYGCPDSGGCNSAYAGFTKQVENAAWQFRYNYERADDGYADYQVNQNFCFNDYNGQHCGRYDNKATAALYRYTPHVYNGNYNFWNLYTNTYNFRAKEYSYSVVSQSDYVTFNPGQAAQFTLTIRNTGRATWTRGVVNLGTDRGKDRVPRFLRESGNGSPYPSGWGWENRVVLQESSVAPGATGTFKFWMQASGNMGPGTYREYFRPVADGVGWLDDYGIYWDVTVRDNNQINALKYKYQIVSQSDYVTVNRGQAAQLSLRIKNTGTETWTRGVVNLGTDRNRDRIPLFLRESGNGSPYPSGWGWENRVVLQESSVAPGETGTFTFWMQATTGMGTGTYREYFRPVADGTGWMDDKGIYWDITVR